jgi:hypothetical protein
MFNNFKLIGFGISVELEKSCLFNVVTKESCPHPKEKHYKFCVECGVKVKIEKREGNIGTVCFAHCDKYVYLFIKVVSALCALHRAINMLTKVISALCILLTLDLDKMKLQKLVDPTDTRLFVRNDDSKVYYFIYKPLSYVFDKVCEECTALFFERSEKTADYNKLMCSVFELFKRMKHRIHLMHWKISN